MTFNTEDAPAAEEPLSFKAERRRQDAAIKGGITSKNKGARRKKEGKQISDQYDYMRFSRLTCVHQRYERACLKCWPIDFVGIRVGMAHAIIRPMGRHHSNLTASLTFRGSYILHPCRLRYGRSAVRTPRESCGRIRSRVRLPGAFS